MPQFLKKKICELKKSDSRGRKGFLHKRVRTVGDQKEILARLLQLLQKLDQLRVAFYVLFGV